MKTLVEFLEKLRFQVLALAIGAILVVLSNLQADDVTRLKFVPLSAPVYPVFAVGVILILIGVVGAALSAYAEGHGPTGARSKVSSSADCVTVDVGQNSLTVKLGQLETSVAEPSLSLVVLPANEYFNDKCINDTRSALGAFVQSKFAGRSSELESAIGTKLRDLASRKTNIDGKEIHAYGLGTAVYLDRALSESFRLLIVAATTERPGEGLRGDLSVLFPIVREANRTAREHRLSQIFLPLIGAGHGSIRPSQALLVQLFAWCEILYSNPGQKTSVNIIVFRPAEPAKSELTIKQISYLVRVATGICELRPTA